MTMNLVFLSPHFPPNYFYFCVHLRNLGANVLGLADEPDNLLRPELRVALSSYYRVNDMHNYDELVRACGYFTHQFGKLDRMDSLNEYWLETEARLRLDFNIFGLKPDDLPPIKRKSIMKRMFARAGVRVARGKLIKNLNQAKKLIDQVGYPVVAKPDVGVGAAHAYKIHDLTELISFFEQKPPVDYIIEEFVEGDICTFDGLVDREGNLVFYTSHVYSHGVLETVANNDLIYYYSLRQIPADLEAAGRKVLKTFNVRERFFHFEFFRTKMDSEIIALEVNMRPPGGMTTDMFNYANDIDIYHEWAHVVVHNRFTAEYSRKYHCCYIARRLDRSYRHSHEEILDAIGDQLCHHSRMSDVFAKAMGDYGYLVRSPHQDEIHAIAQFIQAQT